MVASPNSDESSYDVNAVTRRYLLLHLLTEVIGMVDLRSTMPIALLNHCTCSARCHTPDKHVANGFSDRANLPEPTAG